MMSSIGSIGTSQNQQYLSQVQNLRVNNSRSEEASESPVERAAEANVSQTHKLDVRA